MDDKTDKIKNEEYSTMIIDKYTSEDKNEEYSTMIIDKYTYGDIVTKEINYEHITQKI